MSLGSTSTRKLCLSTQQLSSLDTRGQRSRLGGVHGAGPAARGTSRLRQRGRRPPLHQPASSTHQRPQNMGQRTTRAAGLAALLLLAWLAVSPQRAAAIDVSLPKAGLQLAKLVYQGSLAAASGLAAYFSAGSLSFLSNMLEKSFPLIDGEAARRRQRVSGRGAVLCDGVCHPAYLAACPTMHKEGSNDDVHKLCWLHSTHTHTQHTPTHTLHAHHPSSSTPIFLQCRADLKLAVPFMPGQLLGLAADSARGVAGYGDRLAGLRQYLVDLRDDTIAAFCEASWSRDDGRWLEHPAESVRGSRVTAVGRVFRRVIRAPTCVVNNAPVCRKKILTRATSSTLAARCGVQSIFLTHLRACCRQPCVWDLCM